MRRRSRGSAAPKPKPTGLMSWRMRKGTAFVLLVPWAIVIAGSAVFAVIIFLVAFDGPNAPSGYWECMQGQYEGGSTDFERSDPFCFDPDDPAVRDMPAVIRKDVWEERRQDWSPVEHISLFPDPTSS